MKKSDLQFEFPQELIATEPLRPSRVLLNEPNQAPTEISFSELLTDKFSSGDLLILNETKVIPSRIFSSSGEEFLFVKKVSLLEWDVLFPAKKFKVGDVFDLPGEIQLTLLEKGIPQRIRLSKPIDFEYFDRYGQINLPPYILSERKGEKFLPQDRNWYQTKWAKETGSVAAPTASLHFSMADLEGLKNKGVEIGFLTLHVGLGTFLPLRAEELKDHEMHSEWISVSKDLLEKAASKRKEGKRVWALGTTVARALESAAQDHLELGSDDIYRGESRLFIYPPYEFRVINGLLTNFHQPESTLLALVFAFFGMNQVKAAYTYAIEKRFRLFSYGDLSVWIQ